MARLSNLLRAGLLAYTVLADASPGSSSQINWGPCSEFNSTEPIQCANLTVPLDYTQPELNKTLQLQLLRIPALRQPSRGSILFNFGGPSVAGRPTLAASGGLFRNSTSEYHDLVTFDPRGTGNTLPFSCFDDEQERVSYFLKNPKAWGSLIIPYFWAKSSDNTPGRLWASAKLFVDKCFERNGEIGGLIGSAFVARDMMQIVDALGEDGLLRYWGGSYGTLLGQTAAAMFPERIDRMVLDGNLNPHEYYHGYDDEQWTDSDKAFSAVFQSCVANRSDCLLAQRYQNQTAAQLEDTIYTLIHDLNDRPIPFNGNLIDYGFVKTGVMTALYSPDLWVLLDIGFDALISRNLTRFTEVWDALSKTYGSIGSAVEAQMGIRCSDKIVRMETLDEFLPIMERQFGISRVFGDVQTGAEMICAQWRFPAKGQYTGDFHVKTRHPVLFIGNTADAFTPLASARNASAGFEGSVVLQTNGYGVSSLPLFMGIWSVD
ncbi:tripeptidyl-peptidase sed1 [Colletotrichum spaethianum]|uniref:Tripeptidyl-peptidase sed1 n=1 Tax=Colletotrichum spaethianum TaxID=700344 RepID=A0AA37PCL5_9PEZI|nr:tripeptidyl-peptidase sed1 [Colletotrichum spaethianum]GKT49690.1 tripeptidyl-peptidase sed1 [Colletotrichum spaethianum]